MYLYLGNFNKEIGKDEEYLLKILTVAAKQDITKYWLRKDTCNLDTFTGIVKNIQYITLIR